MVVLMRQCPRLALLVSLSPWMAPPPRRSTPERRWWAWPPPSRLKLATTERTRGRSVAQVPLPTVASLQEYAVDVSAHLMGASGLSAPPRPHAAARAVRATVVAATPHALPRLHPPFIVSRWRDR